MKRYLYEVREIRKNVFGVYSRDFGSNGGWHLLKTFVSEEDANSYIHKLKV